jgi:hypothetical protein
MKLAVYSSRTRGFDGRIFVVRTVNILQQSTLVTPYIEEQKQIITSQNPTKTEAGFAVVHQKTTGLLG